MSGSTGSNPLTSWPPGRGPPRLWAASVQGKGFLQGQGWRWCAGSGTESCVYNPSNCCDSFCAARSPPCTSGPATCGAGPGVAGAGLGLDGLVSESPVAATLVMSGLSLWADGRHPSPAGPRSGARPGPVRATVAPRAGGWSAGVPGCGRSLLRVQASNSPWSPWPGASL